MESVNMINIDADGLVLDFIEVPLYDEEGNPNGLLNSPFVVPLYEEPFHLPKWDFELKKWIEGNPGEALESAKINKINSLRYGCDTHIEGGFTYNEYEFFFTKEDQRIFDMQLTFCLAFPEDDQVPWKTKNSGVEIFTRDEFFLICRAAKNHYSANKGALWQLEGYINNLQTVEEINQLGSFEDCLHLIDQTGAIKSPEPSSNS